MARLRNKNMSVPGGYKFIQPETGFKARQGASFEAITNALMVHRRANPALAKQHGWATDHDGCAADVEKYNADICLKMGWTQYLAADVGEPPLPKSRPPSGQEREQVAAAGAKVKKIWAGVRTLNDWLTSGIEPVAPLVSHGRAAVCAACPKNGAGDFTKWFTQPASEAIRRQLETAKERKLETKFDDKLNICEVCLCPMKLKVHTPITFIKRNLTDAMVDELRAVKGCWIVAEL